ncbi:hypothetical protein EL17_18730 [Anditalea andensis]|uniref:Uncharacterized protein n=1 Tax=Anditalea andensis TaxID=1048983 RepID=A0A074LEM5_9BACT|nr:hypothetical protein EL17_18730 [Anditalea andensis]
MYRTLKKNIELYLIYSIQFVIKILYFIGTLITGIFILALAPFSLAFHFFELFSLNKFLIEFELNIPQTIILIITIYWVVLITKYVLNIFFTISNKN